MPFLPPSTRPVFGSGDWVTAKSMASTSSAVQRNSLRYEFMNALKFWTGSSGGREGFWAELSSDAESRSEIDQHFQYLLPLVSG